MSIIGAMEISETDENVARCIVKSMKDELLGLLDFYSDRAGAHASISIAVVFGVFGVLAIYRSKLDSSIPILPAYCRYLQTYWWYFLPFLAAYVILWGLAAYLVLNFGWYTEIADRVRYLLFEREDLIKGFAIYREHLHVTNLDDFLNDKTHADWRYATSKSLIGRYISFIRKGYVELRFPAEPSLERERWEELRRITGEEDLDKKPTSKKSLITYLGLAILPILIFVIKFISDWMIP